MDVRRLYKSDTDKMICGVCGGIGEFLNVDPTLVRLLWAILTFTGPGLCSLAEKLGVPFFTYTGEELAAVPGAFTESEFVRQVTGVGSVCERAAVAACREASEDTRLLMKKYARDGVTVAAACFIPELFKGSER